MMTGKLLSASTIIVGKPLPKLIDALNMMPAKDACPYCTHIKMTCDLPSE